MNLEVLNFKIKLRILCLELILASTCLTYCKAAGRSSGTDGGTISNGSTSIISNMFQSPVEGSTRCFDDLGCLETSSDWFHFAHRPINLAPEEPSVIDTRFYLHKRNVSNELVPLQFQNITWLLQEGFANAKDVKVIVHGYLDNAFSSWLAEMSGSLEAYSGTIVVVVDWSRGSLTGYLQAVANARIVALEISKTVSRMVRENAIGSAEKVHCIGHSLGAHICGYVGSRIRLGKITGLDPAGPLFEGMPEVVRLDETDADFVEVLHTNGGTLLKPGYGINEPCGHIDFYANDGIVQPGCDSTNIPLVMDLMNFENLQRNVFACSHHRAIAYYTEAIAGDCMFVGHACEDYDTYINGDCGTCEGNANCAALGLPIDSVPKVGDKYYISTGRKQPYCVNQYILTVQTAWPKQAEYYVHGKLSCELRTADGKKHVINFFSGAGKSIEHGKSVQMLITSDGSLDSVTEVRIMWSKDSSTFRGSICLPILCNGSLYLKYLEISPVHDTVATKAAAPSTKRFCSNSGRSYTVIALDGSSALSRVC